ncbi:SPW repeat protein [Rhizobium sp. RAF36]|uniref:SPW repeat protein n=1 Tax=Rhizobium sp. RAF36 TaxID=3233055 RepID=UPI003F972A8B
MSQKNPSKALEATNITTAICLACAALMFTEVPVAAWNAVVCGAMILTISIKALNSYGERAEWLNLSLGCWAALSPFVLGFSSSMAATWTHVVLGAIVACVAAAQLALGKRANSGVDNR